MRTNLFVSTLAIAVLSFTSLTQADDVVDISIGNSSYFWDPAAPQTASFDNGLGDVLFEDQFIIRYADKDPLFGNPIVSTESLLAGATGSKVQYNGTTNTDNVAVSSWDLNGGAFGAEHLYTVSLTQTISGGGYTLLDYQWDVVNVGGDVGSAFSLFHFFDYDINPFGTNSATAGFDSDGDVRIDMTGDDAETYVKGLGADRFELRAVGGGTRLSVEILGSETYNLDNDPTFLTDTDITGAVQWERNQAGIGGSVGFSGQAAIVPEPSGLALLSISGIACFIARRRRS